MMMPVWPHPVTATTHRRGGSEPDHPGALQALTTRHSPDTNLLLDGQGVSANHLPLLTAPTHHQGVTEAVALLHTRPSFPDAIGEPLPAREIHFPPTTTALAMAASMLKTPEIVRAVVAVTRIQSRALVAPDMLRPARNVGAAVANGLRRHTIIVPLVAIAPPMVVRRHP